MTESYRDLEAERRELMQALQICLSSADSLGFAMVGIYLSSAIDCLDAVVANEGYKPQSSAEKF